MYVRPESEVGETATVVIAHVLITIMNVVVCVETLEYAGIETVSVIV